MTLSPPNPLDPSTSSTTGLADSPSRGPSRRQVLAAGGALAASLAVGRPFEALAAEMEALPVPRQLRRAERVGEAPFLDGGSPLGSAAYFDEIVGRGLTARRALDLSDLAPGEMVTPTDRFFVRTATPDRLPPLEQWRLNVRTLGNQPLRLSLEELRSMARPMGVHLASCIENGPGYRYGLMSAAEWTGIPLRRLFKRTTLPESPWTLLVEGFDQHSLGVPSLQPGASWVLTERQVYQSNAFLATEMNGEPLPMNHGAPLRLVVPGWYACTWIKWVYTLVFLGKDGDATPQMKEYAGKLGEPEPDRLRLARSLPDASYGWAAVPVRVEEWRRRRRRYARVVGVLWGPVEGMEGLGRKGDSPELLARIGDASRPEEVEIHPGGKAAGAWRLWSHTVRLDGPGRYPVRLSFRGTDDVAREHASGRLDRSFEIS